MTALQPPQAFTEATEAPLQRRERRPVTLAAAATREDGSLVDLTVVDLSYDGCGVISTESLAPGEQLSLSVLRRGGTPVTVRWAEGTRAGLSFTASTSDDQPARQP